MWVKDTVSKSPKTVYSAPEGLWPLVSITYDPEATYKWSAEYAYFNNEDDTQESVETLMGV